MSNILKNNKIKRRVMRYVQAGDGYNLKASREDLPVLAATDVLVNIKAASLNYRDLLIKKSGKGALKDGLIALSDGAGEVVATGQQVTQWRKGDRVSPLFFREWANGPYIKSYGDSAAGGGNIDGVLSDYISVPEKSLVRIPESLSYEEAATLPCAALTAWHALVTRGNISTGDTVLIQGTGGVALFGLQIAKAKGAKIILISSSDEKRARAKEMGATETVNYRNQPDWDVAVNQLTDGIGASHILELGGPDTFERSLKSLAAEGHIFQIGVLTGFGPQANLLQLQFINANINGINVGSGEQFQALSSLIDEKKIKPVIDKVFTFDEVEKAYDHLASGQHFGKLVIRL